MDIDGKPGQRLVYPILSVSCELLCINWNER